MNQDFNLDQFDFEYFVARLREKFNGYNCFITLDIEDMLPKFDNNFVTNRKIVNKIINVLVEMKIIRRIHNLGIAAVYELI